MVNGLNKVVLIGNVGRDPEFRSTNDGKEVALFTMATSDSWKDRLTGEKKDRTEWHRIVVYNDGLVKVIKSYLKKGSKIYLEGSLHTRKWVDKLGQDRYVAEIILQNYNAELILLDSKNLGEKLSEPDQMEDVNETTNDDIDYSEFDDNTQF